MKKINNEQRKKKLIEIILKFKKMLGVEKVLTV